MKLLAITVLLVACGGGKTGQPTTPPPPKPITCARAADGMVGLLIANKNPKPPDDAVDGLRNMIRERCAKDAWSTEAQRCLGDMKTADDANVCGTLLTDDQQAALVQAQSAPPK